MPINFFSAKAQGLDSRSTLAAVANQSSIQFGASRVVDLRSNGSNGAVVASTTTATITTTAATATAAAISNPADANGAETNARAAARLLNGHGGHKGQKRERCAKCDGCGGQNRVCVCAALSV